MKRLTLLTLVLSVLLLSGIAAGAPNGALYPHATRCVDTSGAIPKNYGRWTPVQMLLAGGGAELWITSPANWAGHYLIQNYRSVNPVVSDTTPPVFPDWPKPTGEKTGLVTASPLQLECMGYFDSETVAGQFRWVDSIEVLLPS